MAFSSIPEDVLRAAVAKVEEALKKGYKPPGMMLRKGERGAVAMAGEAAGIERMTFRHRVESAERAKMGPDWSLYVSKQSPAKDLPDNDVEARAAERLAAAKGERGFAPVLEGFEIKSTSAKMEDGTWVKQTRAAGEIFETPEGHEIKGVSALLGPDGREIAKWIKTREGDPGEGAAAAVRAAFEGFEHRAVPAPLPDGPRDVDLLTVYPIADHHLGLFAWGKETGADYDITVAENLLLGAMRDLVNGAPASEVGIVLNLGDFLHADNMLNRTERSGATLDVDTRYAKTLHVAARLLTVCVKTALGRHKRVVLRNLPGNHDPNSAHALTLALKLYFSEEPRVTVDDDPGKFFFHRHGKTMIAATHGDMAKPEHMSGLAASMRPDMWGATQWRYALFGHVHHRSKRVSEGAGMIVETFQTLAAKDAWHAASGYVSGRSMTAITYHKERGEHLRQTLSVPSRRSTWPIQSP